MLVGLLPYHIGKWLGTHRCIEDSPFGGFETFGSRCHAYPWFHPTGRAGDRTSNLLEIVVAVVVDYEEAGFVAVVEGSLCSAVGRQNSLCLVEAQSLPDGAASSGLVVRRLRPPLKIRCLLRRPARRLSVS